jgi:hypothetical protein
VLILREKHGTRYVSALTVEELHRAALAIVKQRAAEGWYPKATDYPKPQKPELTVEQSRALPQGPIRDAALQEWHNYRNKLQEHEGVADDIEKMARVLVSDDGALAWEFLDDRRDHEYEGFQLTALETFPTAPA